MALEPFSFFLLRWKLGQGPSLAVLAEWLGSGPAHGNCGHMQDAGSLRAGSVDRATRQRETEERQVMWLWLPPLPFCSLVFLLK